VNNHMKNPNTHNRLVVGSNPAGPTKSQVLIRLDGLRELVELLLGPGAKRKLELRHKPNGEFFQLYDAELILRHQSNNALREARSLLGHPGPSRSHNSAS